MMMGILGTLRLSSNEVVMTRALGALLNQSTAFSRLFIKTFFNAQDPTEVSAQWEVSVGEHGRIDLVVIWRDGGAMHCAVVEHKLKAGEGEDQTSRYRSVAASLWASISAGKSEKASALPHLLFLALLPWESPRDEGFIQGTHEQLIPALRAASSDSNAVIAGLAAEWADELAQFYRSEDDAPAAPVTARLRAETAGGLPKGVLLVSKLADAMSPLLQANGLYINNIYRGSGLGRSWVGLIVERVENRWCRSLSGRAGNADPQAFLHFQVHLPLSGEDGITARIALEMLPYRPQKEARRLYSDLFVDAYKARRSSLIASVRGELQSRGWSVQDRWNYIASKRVGDGGPSIDALAAILCGLFAAEKPQLEAAWEDANFGP
jgi:hypothetical protein